MLRCSALTVPSAGIVMTSSTPSNCMPVPVEVRDAFDFFDADHSGFIAAYRAAFVAIRAETGGEASSPLYPGAREAVARLAARPETLLGVATGKARRGLSHALAAHDLGGFFQTLQTADDHPSKPHPSMLLRALAETGAEALLIVEVEGSKAEIDDQLARIKAIAERHNPTTLRESASEAQSKAIWAGRKAAFGATGQVADYLCMDGTIPTSALPETLGRMTELASDYGLRVANVFHAGDGNLHPLIMFDANDPEELRKAEALGAEILLLCVEQGGCLTGEHGVGVEKRDLMGRQYGQADLEAQMAMKDVFDPAWLLNPAKVFPLDMRNGRRV